MASARYTPVRGMARGGMPEPTKKTCVLGCHTRLTQDLKRKEKTLARLTQTGESFSLRLPSVGSKDQYVCELHTYSRQALRRKKCIPSKPPKQQASHRNNTQENRNNTRGNRTLLKISFLRQTACRKANFFFTSFKIINIKK